MDLLLTNEQLDSLNVRNLMRARSGQNIDLQVIQLVEQAGDPTALAAALIPKLVCHVSRGELGDAFNVALRAHDVLGGELDVLPWEFHWTFLNAWGLCNAFMLDYGASEPLFRRACQVAEAAGQPGYVCRTLINLGRDYHRQGRIAESIEVLTELEYSADLTPSGLMHARSHLAEMFEHHGHWEQARQQLATVFKTDSGLGARELCYFASAHGRALTNLGRSEEAETALERARQSATSLGWAHNIAVVDASLSALRLGQGRIVEARQLAEGAISVFVDGQSVYEEMQARLALARVCLVDDHPAEALGILQDSRVAKMGGAFRHQAERLLVELHRADGDWERVVTHQGRARIHNAEARQDLGSLYTLLTKYQQGPGLREQRRLLVETNETLKSAHHERTELLNIIAHDLRSPLTALGLTLEAIKQMPDVERRAHRIDTAQDTVDRIQGLAAQLSTLSEWEHGSVDFDVGEFEIGRLVASAAREIRSTADRKGIHLVVEPNVAGALLVSADSARVQQILQNLLSNALKYSEEGSTVALVAFVDQDHAPGMAHVRIVDQGQGLSQDDLRDLFGKYTRLSSKPTAGESSSGNGLYIARSFARAMDGDILARSAGKGQGSTFTLLLPLAASVLPQTVTPSRSEQSAATNAQ